MATFIPFGINKLDNSKWMGSIEISPPLNFKEASYLANYLMTWHFEYQNKDLLGLYGVHSDKEVEQSGVTNEGSSYCIRKSKQEMVPSLISTLVLGSNNWDKKSVINSIGMKTHIHGLKYTGHWVLFLIEHFFKKDAFAKHLFTETFGGFQEHVCNGSMIYMDASRENSCIEVKVTNNNVELRGIKKKYIGKVYDGFTYQDYPMFLRNKTDRSMLGYLNKIGISDAYPSEKELLEQDEKIKMTDIWKNKDNENAIYDIPQPSIILTENFKIEYEQYYMENTIAEATLEGFGNINKF